MYSTATRYSLDNAHRASPTVYISFYIIGGIVLCFLDVSHDPREKNVFTELLSSIKSSVESFFK